MPLRELMLILIAVGIGFAGHGRDVAIGNPDRGWNQFVLICVPQAILAMPTEPARQTPIARQS